MSDANIAEKELFTTDAIAVARRKRLLINYSVWILLIALCIVGALSTPLFLTGSNIGNILQQSSILGVIAIGQFVVILTSGIDLSVGSVMALTSMVAAMSIGAGTPVSIFVSLLVGCAVGLVSGLVIVYGGLPPFIVTFAMMAIARGIALTLTQGDSVPIYDSPLKALGFGWPPVLVWAVVLIIMVYVLSDTKVGRYLYAVGGNYEAARVAGIRVKGLIIFAYVVSGVMCGIAGILMLARTGAAMPTAGNTYEMQTIAAVVIGGASLAGGEGKLTGAAVGVVFMTILNNLLQLHNANPFWSFVAIGAVLWIAIGLRNGLERIR